MMRIHIMFTVYSWR